MIAFSAGRYPSAETLIVWLPGLTGLFTPSDAIGTGVLSMTTSGFVGPSTGDRDPREAQRKAPRLLSFASSSAFVHECGEPGGHPVANDPVVALLRLDELAEPACARARPRRSVGACTSESARLNLSMATE